MIIEEVVIYKHVTYRSATPLRRVKELQRIVDIDSTTQISGGGRNRVSNGSFLEFVSRRIINIIDSALPGYYNTLC